MRLKASIIALAVLSLLPGGRSEEAKESPAELFFRPLRFTSPTLSPDGKHLAYFGTKPNGRYALCVQDLATGEVKMAGQGRHENFTQIRWLNNDHLLSVYQDTSMYVGTGLASLDCATLTITPVASYRTSILSIPKARRPNAWIYYNDGAISILEVDGLGKRSPNNLGKDQNLIQAFRAPKDVNLWFGQADGEVQLCAARPEKEDGKTIVYWRPESTKKDWVPVPFDWDRGLPCGSDGTHRGLLITAYEGANTKGLYRVDTATGALSECLYRDEHYSLDNADLLTSSREPVLKGIKYYRDHWVTVWFDTNFRGLQAFVDRQLPETENRLVSWSDDESTFLILSSAEHRPGDLRLLDLKNRRMTHVGAFAPWIDQSTLTRTQVVPFQSRDGLPLKAYLTLPKDVSAEAPVPLVLMFEESLWGSLRGGYNRRAQWLAANGIASLTSMHRGMDGLGAHISERGRYDLAASARDRTDAVKAVLEMGTIDPQRVGVLGFAFGAHLALLALTEEPELFRCAAFSDGMYAPGQVVDLLKKGHEWHDKRILRDLKASAADNAAFRRVPTAEQLQRIKTTILIARDELPPPVAGAVVVPGWATERDADARKLASRLKAANVPHRLAAYPTPGDDTNHWIVTMKVLESFLRDQLVGQPSAPGE